MRGRGAVPNDGRERRRASRSLGVNMKNLSGALVWRGVLALVVGIIAVAWPGITVGAFVILFAVYAFIGAATEAARAFRSAGAGAVAGRLLLAVVNVASGVAALAWPGITALAI